MSRHNYSTTAYPADSWGFMPEGFRGTHPCFDPTKDVVMPAFKAPSESHLRQRLWERLVLWPTLPCSNHPCFDPAKDVVMPAFKVPWESHLRKCLWERSVLWPTLPTPSRVHPMEGLWHGCLRPWHSFQGPLRAYEGPLHYSERPPGFSHASMRG